MIRRILYLELVFCITHISASHALTTFNALASLCSRYHREITMLEIGTASGAYSFSLSKKYMGSYILMDRYLAYEHDKIEKMAYKNMVLVHPASIDAGLLHNLGKCEHFDIVVIRDFEQWDTLNAEATLRAALTLGDHVFIELPERYKATAENLHTCETASLSPGKVLAYFAMHKTFITKARWTSHEESLTNYGIVSNFSEKKMDKQSTNTTSKWIPGINLLTFLALKGVYPTDKMMRKQLKSFKHINHNDLVLGNIVVQGNKIKPIDFQDTRRNVDPAICVKAALKMVIREGRLKQDPETMLRRYSEYLQNHKRRMRS